MDASRRESFDSQHPLLPVSPSTQESQRRPYVLPPDNSGERKVWMDMDLNRRQEGRTKVRNLLYEIVEHEKGRKSPPAEKDIQALTDWKIEILELLDAEGTQPHHYNYEEYPKITMLLSKLKGDLFQSERYPLVRLWLLEPHRVVLIDSHLMPVDQSKIRQNSKRIPRRCTRETNGITG